MKLELQQLDLRYEKLRRRNARKERALVASIAEKDQLLPVVVVRGAEGGAYVLVDGYKRVRALKFLRQDVVSATLWDLVELEALLLERIMRTSDADGALEQGWLLEELNERFALSHEDLAHRFDKSQSWVSRRLALVRCLPREVQERVQAGGLPAHAAMKYLVPMARAKRADCLRLIASLGDSRPSTRDIGALYNTWMHGNAETRELVVTKPAVVLRARQQARDSKPSEKTAGRLLLDDLGVLISVSRRTRSRLAQGLLAHLLPVEEQEAQRVARQAQWECEALFRAAAALLETPSTASGSSARIGMPANAPTSPLHQESNHA